MAKTLFEVFDERPRLQRQFEEFHAKNPRVWELFEKFTLQLITAGRKHYSADAVLHRVRWETALTTYADDGFKINNNHAAYYARKFMREWPMYNAFFRIRNVKAH